MTLMDETAPSPALFKALAEVEQCGRHARALREAQIERIEALIAATSCRSYVNGMAGAAVTFAYLASANTAIKLAAETLWLIRRNRAALAERGRDPTDMTRCMLRKAIAFLETACERIEERA